MIKRMHIGSIQQIEEDDQSEQTKDGQFWVVTGGDEEILFCIGQTILYIHMGRYIYQPLDLRQLQETPAMTSQTANDSQKTRWMMLAQDRIKLYICLYLQKTIKCTCLEKLC